ncbi:MAG: site-specific integrase [Pseudomonadota bacterium]
MVAVRGIGGKLYTTEQCERSKKDLSTPFYIVTIRHDDGERLPIILNAERDPISWANDYLIKARRSSVAAKTLRKELSVLGYLHEFCKNSGIDLMQRARSGNGFSTDEIATQLFRWMRRNFSAHAGGNVVELVVARATVDYRMGKVWEFLRWHMDDAMTRLAVGDNRINHIQAKMKAMETAFHSLRTNIAKHKVEKLGLAPHRVGRLLEICYPGNPENPWKGCYQERNYLILVLLLTFGFRRGELLKIKLRDLRLGGLIPEIRIERRPDDIEDLRAEPPEVKTEARILPCDKFLAQRLQNYILGERKQIPGANGSPFLVLARSGQPISEKRINDIFYQLRRKHPDFTDLHPHLCRHTCNTKLLEMGREKGIEESRLEAHLKYFNGWRTDNSETYTQAAIRKEVQDLSLAHQEAIFLQFQDVPF